MRGMDSYPKAAMEGAMKVDGGLHGDRAPSAGWNPESQLWAALVRRYDERGGPIFNLKLAAGPWK